MMTIDVARRWIIYSSLIITGLQLVFLVIAPVAGYPLEYAQSLALIRIVSPVFLGYLGSATHFIFQASNPTIPVQGNYLGALVKGPLFIYFIVIVAAFFSFGFSNRSGATRPGLSIDDLETTLSIALGLLAVTTGILTAYLFVSPTKTPAAP